MDKVKTITSYTGLSRWLADATEYGWIPRQPIHTPYSSGPTHCVYLYRNQAVIVCETSHKRYEVFEVSEHVTIYHTDDEATEAFIAQRRQGAA